MATELFITLECHRAGTHLNPDEATTWLQDVGIEPLNGPEQELGNIVYHVCDSPSDEQVRQLLAHDSVSRLLVCSQFEQYVHATLYEDTTNRNDSDGVGQSFFTRTVVPACERTREFKSIDGFDGFDPGTLAHHEQRVYEDIESATGVHTVPPSQFYER